MLAGGRGSRLGSREKGEIRIGGERLVDIVVGGALASGCERAIVVGDVPCDSATVVREDPPFGGPVAGLAAALPEVDAGWIMLLACDLPHARLLCHLLAESFHHIGPEFDGLVAIHEGRVQWLSGYYLRSSVEAALARLGDPEGASLKILLDDMKLREVQDPEGLSRDIDTPEELEAIERGNEDT